MKIGAGLLIQQWGRPMTYSRGGVQLFAFKGRIVRTKPSDEEYDYSLRQVHFSVIGDVADFVAGSPPGVVTPIKFDVVNYKGEDYTVQSGYFAGADEDELVKLDVIGGTV